MAEDKTPNPVLDYVKKEKEGDNDGIVTLSTGYRARLNPVGSIVIQEIITQIEPPKVPKFFNEDKQREEENPNHPDYLAAVQEHSIKQTMAATEAMIMLGVDLVDPLPEDGRWLTKLRYMERHGYLDLSGYDLDDPMDEEMLFKKFIAVGSLDIIEIGKLAGLSSKDVQEASQFFPGKPPRGSDTKRRNS